jgi:hypothetical protein
MVMPDGRLRHSVYFSMIESEWPSVKASLERLMASYGGHKENVHSETTNR